MPDQIWRCYDVRRVLPDTLTVSSLGGSENHLAVIGYEPDWCPGWIFLETKSLKGRPCNLVTPALPAQDLTTGEAEIMLPHPSSWEFIFTQINSSDVPLAFLVWRNKGADLKLATILKLF